MHLRSVIETSEGIDSLLQSDVSRISARATPFARAADVDTPRTECALNTEVSTPAAERRSLIQCAIRCEVTGLCGLVYDKNSGLGWS